MPWSQNDLDALDSAIKKGVRSVTYATGSVTYHSLAEMLRLRDVMKGEELYADYKETIDDKDKKQKKDEAG